MKKKRRGEKQKKEGGKEPSCVDHTALLEEHAGSDCACKSNYSEDSLSTGLGHP